MSSVTGRISQIKQPKGGYINPNSLSVRVIQDSNELNPIETENISPQLVGTVVDYLTRFRTGTPFKKAFEISLRGLSLATRCGNRDIDEEIAWILKDYQTRSDRENLIVCSCKLVTLDVWYRNFAFAMNAPTVDDIEPNRNTIQNIEIMVERGKSFWKEYGPIVKDGFTFEPDGYTEVVNAGDGDFLTRDTLWDFKVLRRKPTSKHTLQLMMYWIMGQHSGQEIFKNIDRLGIFNPRLNEVYTIKISDIPEETIREVEREVICY